MSHAELMNVALRAALADAHAALWRGQHGRWGAPLNPGRNRGQNARQTHCTSYQRGGFAVPMVGAPVVNARVSL